jgi:branched-chain amino acid transport system substrate-binding protein
VTKYAPPALIGLKLCAASLMLSACVSPQPDTAASGSLLVVEAGEPIRIGVAVAQSGPGLEEIGTAQMRGVALAVQEVGTIAGFPLEIVSGDSGCSAQEGLAAAETLAGDPTIAAVIGHTCNSSCAAAASVYEETGLTLISPSCGGEELTEPLTHSESFLRTIYDDSVEGALAAEFAFYELGARRAALVNDGTPESETLLNAFDSRFTGLGGEVTTVRFSAADAEDAAEMWSHLRDLQVDVLYAPLLPDDAAGFVQGRKVYLPDALLIGSRTYQNHWLLDQTGQGSDGVFFSSLFGLEPSMTALNEAYTIQYGEPPTTAFHAYAYDATMLALQAIDSVGVKVGRRFEIDREALQEAIYATSTYSGTTGTITCTNTGDCSGGEPAIYQIVDGGWDVVYAP